MKVEADPSSHHAVMAPGLLAPPHDVSALSAAEAPPPAPPTGPRPRWSYPSDQRGLSSIQVGMSLAHFVSSMLILFK